ncbi:hypothetical protein PR003_g10287 [Phytophthora rubi]|uniref:Uncharacterized protein n=1 Tax=Phytophthora rubi TaxID=129364 RepID=A0A6A4FE06_9STRA|nr:hypothetical protein PR001_g11992 [Phytophthora rubi]KAE9028277.1 hypothetical protein PR002_g10441 [Phytophthora rubi]KAE9340842.1 hypothetical protein PR003_g10287 [Phytophthora rubi]
MAALRSCFYSLVSSSICRSSSIVVGVSILAKFPCWSWDEDGSTTVILHVCCD